MKKDKKKRLLIIALVSTITPIILGVMVFLLFGKNSKDNREDVNIEIASIEEIESVSEEETTVPETTEEETTTDEAEEEPVNKTASPSELRGVWISYHEWMEMPSEEAAFKASVDKMMDRVVELKMNTVYVHVRADADAMYPSSIFPWSAYITGTQGKDPGYDPFAYFVEAAHKRNIRIHAWINPYRVSHSDNPWDKVCTDNPARKYLEDGDPSNDRWVLKQGDNYYFNPAVPEVRQLIVKGVEELVSKYAVDGVHLDDYFYPVVDDSKAESCFDKPEYDASGSSLSIANWRRENVNILLKDMYATVKSHGQDIEFGVSPAGNLENVRSDRQHFADVDKWLSTPGYVDYVMPQLYWGFEPKRKSGELAAWAYENNLNSWISINTCDSVKLYVGLPMYIAGTNVKDNNPVSEWIANDDVIARQVTYARNTGRVAGYVFYAYSSFQKPEAAKEVENLMKVFN